MRCLWHSWTFDFAKENEPPILYQVTYKPGELHRWEILGDKIPSPVYIDDYCIPSVERARELLLNLVQKLQIPVAV